MEENKQEVMQNDTEKERLWAVLAYLSILIFIPLLRKKKSDFLVYHVNQGLVLFVLEVCAGIVLAVVELVFKFAAPTLFFIFNIIFAVISLLFLVCHVFGILHALQGVRKKIPFLGEIKLFHPEKHVQD